MCLKTIKLSVVLFAIAMTFVSCGNDDSPSNSEPFTGDVVLESQQEVIDFGNNNYSGVNGSLRISSPGLDPGNINDLTPLSSLKFVNGDLEIFNLNQLITLNGLESITEIGGSLSISFCEALTNVNALSSTAQIGNDLQIFECQSLQNVDGFASIDTVPGNLTIGIDIGAGALSLNSLSDISGLSNISSIGGNLQIAGTNVTSLSALSGITNVPNSLVISFNESLQSLVGLDQITYVGENLTITQNVALQNLNGLENLVGVTGVVEISSNNQLTSIDGLSSITEIGNFISLLYNNSLTDLSNAFEALTSTDGIAISETSLENFHGFENLTSVNFITVAANPNLNSISGFDSLASSSFLTITNNESLAEVLAFQNLTTIQNFEINQPSTINDPAINLNGFSALTTVSQGFVIEGIANTNVDFLTNLTTVGANLVIIGNENMIDFCGLNTLILGDGLSGSFDVFNNLYNPTITDMQNGDCSL